MAVAAAQTCANPGGELTVRRVGACTAAAGVIAALLSAMNPPVRAQAQAEDPCGPSGNPIACENSRPGSPRSEWDIDGLGDNSIRGFATDISVNRGERIDFKINTSAEAYEVDIYRLGYYGGDGARKVATVQPSIALPHAQPDCIRDRATGLHDCGNWAVSASWQVPADATSGVYIARPRRLDTGGATHIPFIVRDDDGGSDILFQTSDTTWLAYNAYGGNSLYQGAPAGRAYKVSYNRPFVNRAAEPPHNQLFWAEYPMIRWLERQGYDVSYFAGVDGDRRGEEILEHRVFMSVGHDEYWSDGQRRAVEAARDAGVHLAFFSGNEVFWKVRWEDSIDGSETPHRTMVCYKETQAGAKIDPTPVWTGTWRDPRFSPPADGGRPENGLLGTMFTVLLGPGGAYGTAIRVPGELGRLRFWRDTRVADLRPGETAVLADHTLGFEWGEVVENPFRPAGLIRLSSTTERVPLRIVDHGSDYDEGEATHSIVLHRAASGALVFSASTIQWSFGLDDVHDGPATRPDPAMQQATVNLLADMGVQPYRLDDGLVRAVPSTDTVPPVAVFDASVEQELVSGALERISGSAYDEGGVVAGVEVSVDGGRTWRSAIGTAQWAFAWAPDVGGSRTVQVRAVDDSGNLQAEPTTATVRVRQRGCPCSFWDDDAAPAVVGVGDGRGIELGLRFSAAVDGVVTGVRFYHASGSPGPFTVSVWDADGTRLSSAEHDPASAGWQRVRLPEPVPVVAGRTYVVSYHAPSGGFVVDRGYFQDVFVQGPLTAPAPANGVFAYGSGSVFPGQSFDASNFWVDVVFEGDGLSRHDPPPATGTPREPIVLASAPMWAGGEVESAGLPAIGAVIVLLLVGVGIIGRLVRAKLTGRP